jgi:hypothetical protein
MLKHGDLVDAAIRENIIMESIKVDLCSLEIVVMQGESEDPNKSLNIAFKELKHALRGFFKDRVYVWPFHKLGMPNESEEVVQMIVQLEIE